MKKILFLIVTATIVTGCSAKPIQQKEYKARLAYCEKIEMNVNIEKNDIGRPLSVECIDVHGSTFESKLN